MRELRNIVIRLTTKHAGQKLSVAELEQEFDLQSLPGARPGPGADADDRVAQALRHLERQRNVNLDEMLKSWEQAYIEAALRITRGNVSQAAKLLGVNRTTLYSRLSSASGDGAAAGQPRLI